MYGYDTARTPGVLPTLQVQERQNEQTSRGGLRYNSRVRSGFTANEIPSTETSIFAGRESRSSKNNYSAEATNYQSPWSGIQGNYGIFPYRRSNSNSPAHAADVVESFIVTAYAPTGNKTATGTTPTEGKTVAADFSVIPKGSLIEIEGVGQRTVEDTGGAMEGPILDLFMDSEKDCIQFGRKKLKVKIIRRGY